ncbi:MAG TPA: ATP-binding cassette domain-containing protein [Pyrinomonadaceae bacterium]|nr:ATP-binding cassette domain-containing protein [Pyrinomonadaceae bacterium]
MHKSDPVLKVESLSSGYGKKEILRDVFLTVAAGEIVGMIGANGAGKSTLLKTISGLVEQQGGRVTGKIIFGGDDITSFSPSKKAREGIGYMLQGGEIFSNLSVEDNLSLAFQGRNGNEPERQQKFVYELFPALYQFRKKEPGF